MSKASQSLENVLAILKDGSSYISGQTLAKRVGMSRAAVWKQIAKLRRYGYTIDSRRGLGYRLEDMTKQPVPWELKRLLHTSFIGSEIFYYDLVGSTQELAINIAEKAGKNGTVVIAGRQESGRGRLRRKWISPKGGIWLSIIVRPEISVAQSTLLPFVAALAVCDAIVENTKLDARLKWPNDVVISGKKIAGILLDMSAEAEKINYAVIGIGINSNVDPTEIARRMSGTPGFFGVTSLRHELSADVDALALTNLMLKKLEYYLLQLEKNSKTIVRSWKEKSDTIGKKVTIKHNEQTLEGTAVDVNDDGALLVKMLGGETKVIVSGDVFVRS